MAGGVTETDPEKLAATCEDFMKGAKKLYEEGPVKGDMWFFELYHHLTDCSNALKVLALTFCLPRGTEMSFDTNKTSRLAAKWALERAEVILANMAQEHTTGWRSWFYETRWPISHEPLRGDARNALPELRHALEKLKTEETALKTAEGEK